MTSEVCDAVIYRIEEFRRKMSYAPKQNNRVFVCFSKQCTCPMLCQNIFPQNELLSCLWPLRNISFVAKLDKRQ